MATNVSITTNFRSFYSVLYLYNRVKQVISIMLRNNRGIFKYTRQSTYFYNVHMSTFKDYSRFEPNTAQKNLNEHY